ncbi:ArnT family glycosyltransferase [Salinimicrobium sediminilitoris]|uniref:ArnT family glycosyltransferase n=1 Tax=Salinimicrobium sediminilitoris TaxID=2876715 RepID=UPI001E2EC679|nr:glycosyltransferase family 39 protein [Salinimicrobium sediminilitoris]MCC8360756.1 glycosyltransferase family 39 protein [Salinimicrobium sediminilitoris]
MTKNKKYLLYILLVWVLIFLVHLDVIYVNIMEARNFITAREMVTDGNWILTTMNAEARYEKPPLPTWLTAISGMIFGFRSIFGMRLPAALLTLLLLYVFYRFIPKLGVTLKHSFLATLILASSFYIIFMGRNGQWDIFTHSFMMAAIYFLWNFFSSEKNLIQNAIFGALFFGFSFLSKGPVSLYALLLPFLIAYGSIYGFKGFTKKWRAFFIFLIIALFISGWWFLYVRLADPVSFIEITSRETTRWTNYNVRPFYYYWSFFTQSGIWTIPAFVALLYPYLKTRVSNKKAYKFALLWTLAAVVLLSIIPEKKSRYLLPVLIPMALNTSFYIEYLFRNFKELPKKENWVVYFNHGLIATIGLVFPVAGYFLLELEGHWFWYISASIVLFGLGLALLYFLKKREYPKIFHLTVAFICGIIVFAFPLSNAFLKNPDFRNFDELRKVSEAGGFQVYEYATETPEIIWEFGKPIPKLTRENLRLPEEEKFGIIMRERDSVLIDSLKGDFEMLSSERYDLNYVNPEASGYKDRLIRQFYLLKRKD